MKAIHHRFKTERIETDSEFLLNGHYISIIIKLYVVVASIISSCQFKLFAIAFFIFICELRMPRTNGCAFNCFRTIKQKKFKKRQLKIKRTLKTVTRPLLRI